MRKFRVLQNKIIGYKEVPHARSQCEKGGPWMITTYPEDAIRTKLKRISITLYTGIVVAIVSTGLNFFFQEGFLFLVGTGVLVPVDIALFVWRGSLLGSTSLSEGNVLEVIDGKVIAYHVNPFFYEPQECEQQGVQLISLFDLPVVVSRTLRLATCGDVLTCTVSCSVTPGDFQLIYDTFLLRESRSKDMFTPETALRLYINNFLRQSRTKLVLLYQDEMISSDQHNDYVGRVIKGMMGEYLGKELSLCGFAVSAITVSCRRSPFFIE